MLLIFTTSETLTSGFDNNLRLLSPVQQKQLNQRHGYYVDNLGILFQNKLVLRFYKDINPYLNVYVSNVFNSFSPNLYFFGNHPREREKVEEFLMYPAILIAPFLVGIILALYRLNYLVFGYLLLAVVVSGFTKQNNVLGPTMFFPVINLFISMGILKIYNLLRKT